MEVSEDVDQTAVNSGRQRRWLGGEGRDRGGTLRGYSAVSRGRNAEYFSHCIREIEIRKKFRNGDGTKEELG